MMGEVIYAASSLKAVGALIAAVLVLGLVGLLGVVNGITRRHEKIFVRVARGCAGVFFWFLAAALIFFAVYAVTAGSATMNVQVNDKRIDTDTCVDGGTCTRYVLEARSSLGSLDLVVNEEAYNEVQVDSCYLIAYYAGNLLGRSISRAAPDKIDTITRIETAACP